MSTEPKIAVSYLRVSTARQMETASDVDADGNSIATQREANNARAAKLGALIQREFIEPGASAQSIDKRPVFKQLLAYLDEHPEVNTVIVYMRSRAFRNLGDAVITKRRLEAMGVKLVSAKEDFGEGIMADAMEAVTDIINEVQVRMNGEDIKVKMRHKAQMGGTNGRAPIGYRNVRIEHEGRQVNGIAVDDERADLVRQAFELYATGDYSIVRLHDTLAEMGLTSRPTSKRPAAPLSLSQVHTMLQDPYYIGLVSYKGEQFQGRHEPLISDDLFERVQIVLEERSARGQRQRVHHHYLKGLLYCGRCDAAGRKTRLVYTLANGRGGTYEYFVCLGRQQGNCDLPHLPAESVEWWVADHYVKLGLPANFLAIIRGGVQAALTEAQSSIQTMHDSYRAQLAKLARQEERLLDLAIDGSVPQDRLKARLRKVQVQRKQAEAGLKQTADKLERGARHVGMMLDLLDEPAALYAKAPDEGRRDLNSASFVELRLEDGEVVSDLKTPLVQELHDLAEAYGQLTGTALGSRAAEDSEQRADNVSQKTEEALLAALLDAGSSKASLVPPTGFEPALPP